MIKSPYLFWQNLNYYPTEIRSLNLSSQTGFKIIFGDKKTVYFIGKLVLQAVSFPMSEAGIQELSAFTPASASMSRTSSTALKVMSLHE